MESQTLRQVCIRGSWKMYRYVMRRLSEIIHHDNNKVSTPTGTFWICFYNVVLLQIVCPWSTPFVVFFVICVCVCCCKDDILISTNCNVTGYCGADMKALCTEVALLALRRRYPQIYTSSEKLQIDVTSINITARDFYHAMQSIVPASQRSVTSPARALTTEIRPLLQNLFQEILRTLNEVFPSVLMQLSNLDVPGMCSAVLLDCTSFYCWFRGHVWRVSFEITNSRLLQ